MTDETPTRPIKPLAQEPKTLALVIAVLVLLIGIPAGLYAWAGQWQVALALVVAFVAMVGLTAYALKVAVEVERGTEQDDD